MPTSGAGATAARTGSFAPAAVAGTGTSGPGAADAGVVAAGVAVSEAGASDTDDSEAGAVEAVGEESAPGDAAVPAVGRAWPVGGRGARPRVLRGWEPPATVYGRGHRGVDLAAPAGDPVRAVAPGRVLFAGRVAGRGVISVALTGTGDPPLRTTYEPVRASVQVGDEVAPGEVIGTVEATGSHCAATCVHWGLLRGDTYLNPLALLPAWLLNGGPSRLLPVLGVPLPQG
ncbi:murein hydrolase activator EnvC family protein [Streptomyces sp. NPDC003697]